ncbi:MAG: hypothetical protein QOJ11_4171 [Frankiales bacterium]|nr:hypothetical protein [Frankiales bacterium]
MWFGLTGLIVLVGLCVQAYDTAGVTTGRFKTPVSRMFNLLFFFTIESNIVLMLTCLLLALRLTGWGPVFAVFRLVGLVGITITGIVYYAVLKDLLDLHGAAYVSDVVLHTVSPLMAVLGWLVFGPRGLATARAAVLAVVFPAAYLAVMLARGPIVSWYPYPFVDVLSHGYLTVALNCVVVAVLFLAVAFGAARVDRWLDGRFVRAA